MLAFAQKGIKYHFVISGIANLFIITYSMLTICQALLNKAKKLPVLIEFTF